MLSRVAVVASVAALSFAVGACSTSTPKPAPAAPAPVAAPPPAPVLKSGLDLSGFDRSVRPQDDLYKFAGGAWLANTPIPADRSNYGSFTILDDKAQEEVKALIVAASEQPNRPQGSDAQKVGDFYLSFMDTNRVEYLGLAPLKDELARIDAIATPRDVARYIGHNQRIGVAQRTHMASEKLRCPRSGSRSAAISIRLSRPLKAAPFRSWYSAGTNRTRSARPWAFPTTSRASIRSGQWATGRARGGSAAKALAAIAKTIGRATSLATIQCMRIPWQEGDDCQRTSVAR